MVRSSLKQQHNCILDSFKDSHLSGILLGLDLKDGELGAQPSFFPCCQGEASYADAQRNAVVVCNLKKRIIRAQAILSRYISLYGNGQGRLPHQLTAKQSLQVLTNIQQTLKHKGAHAVTTHGKKDEGGIIWSIALALVYRFDLRTHVFTFNKDSSASLYDEASQGRKNAVQAIVIEQIDKLWDPYIVLDLESYISFAYQSNIPLWLEFITPEQAELQGAEGKRDLTLKGQFSKKIQQLKQRSPLSYLSPSALSKLKAMYQ